MGPHSSDSAQTRVAQTTRAKQIVKNLILMLSLPGIECSKLQIFSSVNDITIVKSHLEHQKLFIYEVNHKGCVNSAVYLNFSVFQISRYEIYFKSNELVPHNLKISKTVSFEFSCQKKIRDFFFDFYLRTLLIGFKKVEN